MPFFENAHIENMSNNSFDEIHGDQNVYNGPVNNQDSFNQTYHTAENVHNNSSRMQRGARGSRGRRATNQDTPRQQNPHTQNYTPTAPGGQHRQNTAPPALMSSALPANQRRRNTKTPASNPQSRGGYPSHDDSSSRRDTSVADRLQQAKPRVASPTGRFQPPTESYSDASDDDREEECEEIPNTIVSPTLPISTSPPRSNSPAHSPARTRTEYLSDTQPNYAPTASGGQHRQNTAPPALMSSTLPANQRRRNTKTTASNPQGRGGYPLRDEPLSRRDTSVADRLQQANLRLAPPTTHFQHSTGSHSDVSAHNSEEELEEIPNIVISPTPPLSPSPPRSNPPTPSPAATSLTLSTADLGRPSTSGSSAGASWEAPAKPRGTRRKLKDGLRRVRDVVLPWRKSKTEMLK